MRQRTAPAMAAAAVAVVAATVLACGVTPCAGERWALQSRERSSSKYQHEVLAMEALTRFNDDQDALGPHAAARFEAFVSQFPSLMLTYRSQCQQVGGVVHEKDAMRTLIQLATQMYGEVVVPEIQILSQLGGLAAVAPTWVDIHAGAGYLASQLHSVLKVKVHAFALKPPSHNTWATVLPRTALSPHVLNTANVLVLTRPCNNDPEACWGPLVDFARSPTHPKALVYIGEPRGHCCGDMQMWEHVCEHWALQSATRLSVGLPGSYDHLLVFTPRGGAPLCGTCEGEGCGEGGGAAEVCYGASEVVELDETSHFRQYLDYCARRHQ